MSVLFDLPTFGYLDGADPHAWQPDAVSADAGQLARLLGAA